MFWCTFGACCLTAHLIMKHCSNFSNSRQQRCICRILLMVPIYSGDSWLSLRFFRQSVYFDTGN
jgi:bacteriorhodopsin